MGRIFRILLILGSVSFGFSLCEASSALRMGSTLEAASENAHAFFEAQRGGAQIRSKIRLSELAPVGPTVPKQILRAQRNIVRHDRVSYSFFGESGSRIEDFVFKHSDESTSLEIE
ncbi:MAG: hypothetical protein K2X47_03360 [Bdellovibrionales bacterium]|nr:hypothetical protein [Bdellovibrionales bacterium]